MRQCYSKSLTSLSARGVSRMVSSCAHGPKVELSDEKPTISPDCPRARKASNAPPGVVTVAVPLVKWITTWAGRFLSAICWSTVSRRKVELFSVITSQGFFQFVQTGQNIRCFGQLQAVGQDSTGRRYAGLGVLPFVLHDLPQGGQGRG